MILDENKFKSQYVATFLATYMANRYERDCQNGHEGKSYDHQPVEDAKFLADCAWRQVLDKLGE
jgi:hypothetical protein